MAYTTEQYARGIAKAEAAGDQEAAEYLRREALQKLTGTGSFLEKLGAGVQDVVTGTKQLFGGTTPEEVRERERIAGMATGPGLGGKLVRGLGAAGVAAPAMLIPGAQSVAGAALLGAGTGLLMPTEDENVVGGKVKNAVIGGATGGLMQKGLNVAIPAAGQVLRKTLDAGRQFTQAGRQRLAEEAFIQSIPQAERAAAEQALAGAAGARTAPLASGVSGAPITAGVATRNPALLAAEREAREAGGMLGQPFRDLDQQAGNARWNFLQQELGADVPALRQGANDVYDNFIQNAALQRPFDQRDAVGQSIVRALNSTENQTAKAELERVLNQFIASRDSGSIAKLHEFRQTALGDALDRLYASDRRGSKLMRNRIKAIEEAFDSEMNKALGPGKQWTRFLDDYQTAARARDQGIAGTELVETLGNAPEAFPGVPRMTQQKLANEASKTNKFDQPVYSQQGQDALDVVRREMAEQAYPSTLAGPKGSATAQNLNPTDRVLSRAMAAQNRRITSPGHLALGGFALGEPVSGLALAGARAVTDRNALNIAERLIQLHVNPAQAAQVLAQANVPPQVRASVLRLMAQRAGRVAPALPAALAIQGGMNYAP